MKTATRIQIYVNYLNLLYVYEQELSGDKENKKFDLLEGRDCR